MKQPLMLLPPAQAEALYDIILQQPSPASRPHLSKASERDDSWDDEQLSESSATAETFSPRPIRKPSHGNLDA